MRWQLSWLLTQLALCALGCDDVIIGNAYYEAGLKADAQIDVDTGASVSDAGSEAGLDAAEGVDAIVVASSEDAGAEQDAQVDSSVALALSQASEALGIPERWLSRETLLSPAGSVLLAFQPAPQSVQGTFIGYCPDGCSLGELFRDPVQQPVHGSSAPVTFFQGNYALYYLTEQGTVLGVLFTEGAQTLDLQFVWSNRPMNGAVDEIFIGFAPLGRLGFLPDLAVATNPPRAVAP